MTEISKALAAFPKARLVTSPTPLEPLARLSRRLGIELWIKRDDLTGLGMGGNKNRQLEYYLGAALAEQADTILITGAVQSNFVRSAAAAAAKYGMRAVLQLEQRVAGMGPDYHQAGNVFLGQMLGAEYMHYPRGEDEAGADNALRERARQLTGEGRRPYVIPLALDNKPLGALGYIEAACEMVDQGPRFDAIVVASGSGATHGGLLVGLRALGVQTPVHGICVRRDADRQTARMNRLLGKIAALVPGLASTGEKDVLIWDGALAPGYGKVAGSTIDAMQMMARYEGLLLDPVYTGKCFAGLLGLLGAGRIRPGTRVLLVHTGGLPALFAYQNEIAASLAGAAPV